jgi:hypothetical protein
MKVTVALPLAEPAPAAARRALARRITDAHRVLADSSWLAFSSSSGGIGERGAALQLNLSFVLQALPDEKTLLDACARTGAMPGLRREGASGDGNFMVKWRADGTDVQVLYLDRQSLNRALDETELPATALQAPRRLAQEILKAEPLAGHAELARLQARLTRLPPKLACAIVKRFLATPTPWRAISQLGRHYEVRRCRELQVDACYRLCAVRAALSQRYFTRFQVKRSHGLTPRFENAPPGLAERIARLMEASPRVAFAQLFALEGEVLDQVAREMPQVNLAAAQAQRAAYEPAFN